MRCSICGGHLTNQRCDDCGMIFPPEDRYTLHHTEDPNCPSHVEPGQKARPVSLAADYARHRAESAPRPQPSQRPTKPTYQNSNSGRRKGSQIAGLIIALVWVVICLMISFANISFANMRDKLVSLSPISAFLFSANETKSPPSTIKNALRAFAISLGNTA